MRILGNIEHTDMKITVFKMDDRITVKFENRAYEIGIKLGAHENLNNLEAIRGWADAGFVEAIRTAFGQIHQSRLAADGRALPAAQNSEFEEII